MDQYVWRSYRVVCLLCVVDESIVQKHDESMCVALVQSFCATVNRETLAQFMRTFLLESNQTAVRWQAHALVLHIYRYE